MIITQLRSCEAYNGLQDAPAPRWFLILKKSEIEIESKCDIARIYNTH
jgi:hypothetical protein